MATARKVTPNIDTAGIRDKIYHLPLSTDDRRKVSELVSEVITAITGEKIELLTTITDIQPGEMYVRGSSTFVHVIQVGDGTFLLGGLDGNKMKCYNIHTPPRGIVQTSVPKKEMIDYLNKNGFVLKK